MSFKHTPMSKCMDMSMWRAEFESPHPLQGRQVSRFVRADRAAGGRRATRASLDPHWSAISPLRSGGGAGGAGGGGNRGPRARHRRELSFRP